MLNPMSYTDARELCQLRIREDGIDAVTALREFRQLTGCGMRDAEPAYRQFQAIELEQKGTAPHGR
jgi:hypothetical protein